jgi:uncharacterized membrane protein
MLALASPDTPLNLQKKRLLLYPLAVLCLWSGIQSVAVMTMEWPAALVRPDYGSDELYFAQYNAQLLLHGENPYQGDRLMEALRFFHITAITPLRRPPYTDPLHPPTSEQQSNIVAEYLQHPANPPAVIAPATTHSYPALSFLLAVPSVWLGTPSLGIAQVLALLALIGGIIALAPPNWRGWILALSLVDVDGIRSVASSDFAIWTVVGVISVWVLRRKAIWAALILGATCAVQQTAWFAVPFYLAYIWRVRGWRAVLYEGSLAAGIFIAINLPWIISTPGEWLKSIWLPMTLPLFPDGSGLIALPLSGALPLWPSYTYSILEFGAWVALLALYTLRWQPRLPLAGLLLPLAGILLAWRSPTRYVILLPFVALVMLLLQRQEISTNEK